MLVTDPPDGMRSKIASVRWRSPRKLTRMTVRASKRVPPGMPAQFMTASIRSGRASSTLSMAFGSPRSTLWEPATGLVTSAMSRAWTSAPASTSRAAVSAPIPVAAPVMSTMRPV